MSTPTEEFSLRSREQSIKRMKSETFDLLIVGGGITGAAVARDASSRGLKVALIEMRDFASGTSSASSKLIHGGLRYLENLEIGLVFEALAERAFLLKAAPHLVRPLKFYWPVYEKDQHGPFTMTLGLTLYDFLTAFRTPGYHRRLSPKKMVKEIPFLNTNELQCGFSYFDASMQDDVLAVETLRAAYRGGAAVANYLGATKPIFQKERIVGFEVEDYLKTNEKFEIRAHQVALCAGPWTDLIGSALSESWKPWLNVSKGVHLVFDLKRLPVPGALVMSHPTDGRISFVIPRTDLGAGVTIVGTTDGPTSSHPEEAVVEGQDVDYLMQLLNVYFPQLKLSKDDIVSHYVGVRPLVGPNALARGSEGQGSSSPGKISLQKVSREHFIGSGPGGVTIVAGGKYTTHRRMGAEIVDFVLKHWKREHKEQKNVELPAGVGKSRTDEPINPSVMADSKERAEQAAASRGIKIERELLERYGAEWLTIAELDPELDGPDGFPRLKAQLRYAIRHLMVARLADFYFRRVPLYMTMKDHGRNWVEPLAEVWAEELGKSKEAARDEAKALFREIDRHARVWEPSTTSASEAKVTENGVGR